METFLCALAVILVVALFLKAGKKLITLILIIGALAWIVVYGLPMLS